MKKAAHGRCAVVWEPTPPKVWSRKSSAANVGYDAMAVLFCAAIQLKGPCAKMATAESINTQTCMLCN